MHEKNAMLTKQNQKNAQKEYKLQQGRVQQ